MTETVIVIVDGEEYEIEIEKTGTSE